jgi:putative FmdB family regulatory protein
MPIYEYQCGECDERFEVIVRSSDEESGLRCPRCDAENLQRVVSVFSSHSAGSPVSCGPSGST